MSKEIPLLFGRGQIRVALPDDADVTIVRKPTMPAIEDRNQAVREAFAAPIHPDIAPALALDQLAAGASSACIAICDITRPVPNHLFLRPAIETMLESGMEKANITILVATGLHRPNLGEELVELVGDPWVLENIRIVNHDARCDGDHVDLGKTPGRGTPVKLNRRFVEADLRIATGLVEPHFMAGYSGGRKVIAPGIAHADTITTFHNHRFMANPAASNCNLKDNPLHEEQLEIVRMIGGAYAINTVIDEDRNLSLVNFGEITASHLAAVQHIERYCRVPLGRSFDVVLTSAAGYPLDKTYYQTVKGMVGAIDILEPGGDLVIVSECSEGVGSIEYADAQDRLIGLGADGFLRSIQNKSFADIDEWQTQMQTKAMAVGKIHLFSGLSPEQRAMTGVQCIDDVEATLRELILRSPTKSIAVIPEGPYVIPYRA